MPLARYRRRHGRQSSDGSLKDALFDQLLQSLAQGGEKIATEEEFGRFVRAWCAAHSGKSFPILDASFPMPIQRRQALNLVNAFTWESYLNLNKAIWEDELGISAEPESAGDEADLSAFHDAWLDWRDRLIGKYRLDGLISDKIRLPHEDLKPLIRAIEEDEADTMET